MECLQHILAVDSRFVDPDIEEHPTRVLARVMDRVRCPLQALSTLLLTKFFN